MYLFVHLILNNRSSPVDTLGGRWPAQPLAAGKLAKYLPGLLGPADVEAQGD